MSDVVSELTRCFVLFKAKAIDEDQFSSAKATILGIDDCGSLVKAEDSPRIKKGAGGSPNEWVAARDLDLRRLQSPGFRAYFDALPYSANLRADWRAGGAGHERVSQWVRAENIIDRFFKEPAAPRANPYGAPAVAAPPAPAFANPKSENELVAKPVDHWIRNVPAFAQYFNGLPYSANLRSDWTGGRAGAQRVVLWARSEKVIEKFFPAIVAPTPAAISGGGGGEKAGPGTNAKQQRNLRIIQEVVAMGFTRPQALQALKRCSTADAAVMWILEGGAEGAKEENERDCCVCYCPEAESNMMMVECADHHWVCRDCLKQHLEVLIKEHKVTDEQMVCPMGCPTTIKNLNWVVQDVVDPEYYEKFGMLRVQKQWAKSHKTVECPDCKFVLEINTEADRYDVKCFNPECRHNKEHFCELCYGKGGHMPAQTCQEYKAAVEADKARKKAEAEDLKIEVLWAIHGEDNVNVCPHCGATVIRGSACKFITCSCKGTFCIICGIKTTRGEYNDGHRCVDRHGKIRSGYQFRD